MPGLPVVPIIKIATNLLGGMVGWRKKTSDEPFSGSAFRVPAGEIHRIPLKVRDGWSIEYGFSSNHNISFRIMDPRGEAIVTRDRSFGEKDRIKVSRGGEYTLLFDNEDSVFAAKDIDCEYRAVKR